ncbi:hypothetical protein CHS0354_009140, partial [Potamilus streckersoni]
PMSSWTAANMLYKDQPNTTNLHPSYWLYDLIHTTNFQTPPDATRGPKRQKLQNKEQFMGSQTDLHVPNSHPFYQTQTAKLTG